MSCDKVTIGATALVWLGKETGKGLKNSLTDVWVNDATASGTLYEADRTTQVATFSMSYLTATNGEYTGTIPAGTTATLTDGNTYRVKVTATTGGNTFVDWLDLIAGY